MNNYTWDLDYISHGAHYSKNWPPEKQKAYNHWYYEHNKDKWKNSNETKAVESTRQDYKDSIKNRKAAAERLEDSKKVAAYHTKNALNPFDGRKGDLKNAYKASRTLAKSTGKYAKSKREEHAAKKAYKDARVNKQMAIQADKEKQGNIYAFYISQIGDEVKKGHRAVQRFFLEKTGNRSNT